MLKIMFRGQIVIKHLNGEEICRMYYEKELQNIYIYKNFNLKK